MLVSGGMAVACVAALTKCCCEPAHISYYPDEEDDDALPIHRRELIAKRLKGKGDASTTLDSVRRKSEKLWRNAQFTPHAEHSDSSKKSPTEKVSGAFS